MKLDGLYKKIGIILVIFILINILWRQTRFYQYYPVFESFSKRLNYTSMELKVGEKRKIAVQHVNNKATYQSSNFRVAYVNQNGVVWGIQKGKTVIIVKVGEKKYKCKVTVK